MGSINEVLPIFDGSCFVDWKIAVKNVLREKALWRIVSREIKEPQTHREKSFGRASWSKLEVLLVKL